MSAQQLISQLSVVLSAGEGSSLKGIFIVIQLTPDAPKSLCVHITTAAEGLAGFLVLMTDGIFTDSEQGDSNNQIIILFNLF